MKKTRKIGILVIISMVILLVAGIGVEVKYHSLENFRQKGKIETQQEFDAYLDSLFRQEITASTIDLHYTLRNPENYGITEYTVTYGALDENSREETVAVWENIEAVLKEVDVKQLTTDRQMTYDILKEEAATELSATNLYLYGEMLRPSTGIQAELPVLMAEYSFYDEGDVQDYLVLLGQTPEYFRQILLFQMEKANEGLFMSRFAAEDIISQCRNFIADKENNYLLETFVDKIQLMSELDDITKQTYIEQNRQAVLKSVIPAYEMLIQGLETLSDAGKNQQGLSYLPKGKEYYEYLVKAYTGSDMTVEEMQQATINQRAKDLSEAAKLISEYPDLLAQTTAYTLAQEDPVAILQELQSKMQQDFPVPPDTNFTVKYVHSSLEEFMAPAFYLSVPIDDISQNAIYMNKAHNYQKLKLYTTLAHEGFPGHLYQNVMERSQDFPAIRSILGTSGYSEGWATYVEMIAYSYADIDPRLTQLLRQDQSALLSLYATADMGIHYDGWTLEEMIAFFGEYQIQNEETLTDIYQLIIEEPAHYLKYYIGYLEFLNLKDYAMELYGEQYSDYKFHEALMKMGPAQFSVLKKYLPMYYSSKAE